MTGGREILKEISLFVLDMDGTFYLGDRRLDGALEFIMRWKRQERSFCFSRIILPNHRRTISENWKKWIAAFPEIRLSHRGM